MYSLSQFTLLILSKTALYIILQMTRFRKSKPNVFCYISGKMRFKEQRKKLSQVVQKTYEFYFDCKIGNQDKVWAVNSC